MNLFEEILKSRGLTGRARDAFLSPSYDAKHDPYLLPDMHAAVERLVLAKNAGEKITIYGDYDIDGLTATTVLLDAFTQFGFDTVDAFIPNRFVEGYGMTVDAVERIAETGAKLIVTVDCGSLSEKEIVRAGELGIDVIVTDHHNVAPVQPPAVAVINPKRLLADYPDEYEGFLLKDDSKMLGQIYPFLDLPGVGVAFKLVQALQSRLDGLVEGQEKWLLDLVALGTVCDVVTLVDENRANVFWGLKVLAKTRRPGLKALMAVADVDQENVNARSLGFALGPRMNAAGRLETAQIALDMLRAQDGMEALEKATLLDTMNRQRRTEQDKILKEAIAQCEAADDTDVIVVSSSGWNHGIVGIVAAKLLEKYKKPTFVLGEEGDQAKGSARSYGNFSAADAIRFADDVITKGGGHKLAAGVTLPTANIGVFRERVNEYYRQQKLRDEALLLLPREDITSSFDMINEQLVEQIATMEPFGNGNPQPIMRTNSAIVIGSRRMGADGQHVKIELRDEGSTKLQLLAFSAPAHFFVDAGMVVAVWYEPTINEWMGRRTVEGRLLHLEVVEPTS